jgi:peroxiredoxin
MARNEKQVALGEAVEDFALEDTHGTTYRLSDYRGKGKIVVLLFWSAECPVSREYDAYFDRLPDRYPEGKVVVLAVDSNVHYGMDEIEEAIKERGIEFPVLRDCEATIADRFGALTTPHIFLVDATGRLAYQGAVDDRTFRRPEATVNYLDEALAAILMGEKPAVTETQPYGCTIVRYH